MIIFLFLLFIVSLYGIKLQQNGFNNDFLSKVQTNSIKGIFIMIVFINHIKEYYEQSGANLTTWYDNSIFLPTKACGQLMVVMFLFYSGYGVMESIKTKGIDYVNAIPRKRVLGTIANFDVAVCIFALAMLLIGMPISWKQFMLSLVGWDSVGNSNWYIFSIVICYILTYIGQKVSLSNGNMITCIMIVVFAFILSFYRGTWWYNTVYAYGAGLIFSEYKDNLIFSMKANYGRWMISVGGGFLLCLCTYLYFYTPFKGELERLGAMVFDIMSVFFALLVVMITMKVRIGNNVLIWLGTNLFPLYIYQRLSMMVLTELYPNALVISYPQLFFIICLLTTGMIAYTYKWWQVKM